MWREGVHDSCVFLLTDCGAMLATNQHENVLSIIFCKFNKKQTLM